MSSPHDPLALARDLSSRAGLTTPQAIERLPGGRNNQALRVTMDDGSDVVLKLYHHDPRDTRDRLGAEWDFLTYVWERGVRNVPEPIVRDRQAHAALISFVDGEKRDTSDLGENDLTQASAFIAASNAPPRDVMALAPGSEACFSLDAHVATVERRVKRLGSLDSAAPHGVDAKKLVSERIVPLWSGVKAAARTAATAAGIDLAATCTTEQMCISPSDFGFHNALAGSDGRITFIDFEYAGRDDPAKLICDFLCQPEIPVPVHLEGFAVDALSDALDLTSPARERARLLRDTYRIKWICIMLNEFQPAGNARRGFAEGADRERRCAAQLSKVRHALSQLQPS